MSRNLLSALLKFAYFSVLLSTSAFPCASCGSGGDDPLILYPNEKWKLYLGQSRTFNYKNISSRGEFVSEGGVTLKDQFTLSSGLSFSDRSFATLTVPFIVNHGDESSQSAFGDPSIALRYTLVLPSIADPLFLPQVQLVAGYRQTIARSIRETEEAKTLIDVFGTGFSEAKLGIDVWYGLKAFKVGAAFLLTRPFSHDYDGVTLAPALGNRMTFTLGYQWNSFLKTTAGVNRDYKGGLSRNNQTLAESDQLNHAVFVNQDMMAGDTITFRLSYSRQAALFDNRNTSQIDSLGVACMKSY